MNTLNQYELVAVCGGLDPLNIQPMAGNEDLQWLMDQLAQQQDTQNLHYLLGGSAE